MLGQSIGLVFLGVAMSWGQWVEAADEQFERSLKAAQENLRTEIGKQYDEKAGQYYGQHHLAVMRGCLSKVSDFENPDLMPFDMVMRVEKTGRIREILVSRDTALARCLRGGLMGKVLPEPPKANYWVIFNFVGVHPK